ncbi:unnamed protein product, partial [Ectocarpus sp. 12 AP-2014]
GLTHLDHGTVLLMVGIIASLATRLPGAPRTTMFLRAIIRTRQREQVFSFICVNKPFHPCRLVRRHRHTDSGVIRAAAAVSPPHTYGFCLSGHIATHRPVQPRLHLELSLADRVPR